MGFTDAFALFAHGLLRIHRQYCATLCGSFWCWCWHCRGVGGGGRVGEVGRVRPLSERKWVKSGGVQEWLKSMFGRMFWVTSCNSCSRYTFSQLDPRSSATSSSASTSTGQSLLMATYPSASSASVPQWTAKHEDRVLQKGGRCETLREKQEQECEKSLKR